MITFDAAWYLATNPDVAAAGIDPLEHYLASGQSEGRLPAPRRVPGFDSVWYLSAYPVVAAAGMDALDHYLTSGLDEGRLPGPTWDDPDDQSGRTMTAIRTRIDMAAAAIAKEIPGHRVRTDGGRILVVGHAAGTELFGAERSLLELLDGFATLGYDVVVTVPTQVNEGYIDDLRARCRTIHIMPVPPRRPNEAPNDELIDHWCRLIDQHSIQAVHVNTIMPREPVLAARRRGVAAVVHAHEIPFGDSAMCAAMGATADEIVANVRADATYVIGNSSVTTDAFDIPARTAVVPNIVDVDHFPIAVAKMERPTVALIGDASLKKGVRDFALLATTLRDRVDARFVIIGPAATAAASLDGIDIPDNLTLAGYAPTPGEALAQADIVVNVSRCRETFARTVLEGMAAGLPIVAYNRGAIPFLVDHRRTGLLVGFDDTEALAEAVERLCLDPELRRKMGAAGREVAVARFGAANLTRALASTYESILEPEEVTRQRANDVVVQLPTINHSENLHPFFAGYRSRWAHTTGVAFIDSTTLVCASLLGRRLYTIAFDPDLHEAQIVAETATRDGSGELCSELMDYGGHGRILASNSDRSSVSLYQIDGHQVRWSAAFEVNNPDTGFCHGSKFVPGHDVIAACMVTATRGIRFIATSDDSLLWSIDLDGRAPKDVAFKSRNRMAVTLQRDLIELYPLEQLSASIALLAFDLDNKTYETLAEYNLPGTALDGLCVYDDRLYAVSQSHDCVMVFDTSNDQLRRLPDMRGFSFPHQVAVSPDGRWLGVACYGDGTVVLRPLTE